MPLKVPLLELAGVEKRFGPSLALAGVSFALQAGEIHALCGENGAGKSTLLKIIGGIWPHGSFGGDLRLGGQAARFGSSRDAQDSGVALIHQELALVPEMSVAENISLGAEPARFGFTDSRAMTARADRLFAELGLSLDARTRVADLGAGERQLVEIAKALSREFRVLVLDEPTASLSEAEADRLLTFLEKLKSRGIGIIYVSHRLKEITRVADRVTVLRDGKSVATLSRGGFSAPDLVRLMVGRELSQVFVPREAKKGREALSVQNLRISGASVGAKPAAFIVREGEIIGLAGLVGSGRTELLEALFGLRPAAGSTIRVGGTVAAIRSPRDAMRLGIALVSESRKDTGLVVDQAVRPNLTLATLSRFSRAGFIRSELERQEAASAARAFGVKCASIESPIRSLSGGNQQKVVLAKWAALRPRVLLLDEPTRGIDVGSKAEIYDWIRRWADEGAAVLLASSELVEILGLSDRVLALSDKRITAEFDAREATEEKLMAAMTDVHR